MPGLRERKKRKTLTAIHDAAMRLFAERGYGAVTVADIAEAAEVSRATVFAYYPAKEDIVWGEGRLAVEQLEARLAAAGDQAPVVEAMREWVRTLTGWVEPEVVLQRRLSEEVPAVSAARSRLLRDVETVIAAALEREMGPGAPLAPRLAAGCLTAGLAAVEQEAARRMASGGRAPAPEEVDALFDQAVAFVDGGLARLAPRRPRRRVPRKAAAQT